MKVISFLILCVGLITAMVVSVKAGDGLLAGCISLASAIIYFILQERD
jgi:multisubunit Na+/H+ antiporter MnhB subunit